MAGHALRCHPLCLEYMSITAIYVGLRRNVSRGRQTARREFAAFRNKVASTDGTSNSVYSTPRREGWMLLVASCIYVCFMSACILHLRRCHVWWLSSVLSLSPFPPFLSIRASAAFRLFPFSFVSSASPLLCDPLRDGACIS